MIGYWILGIALIGTLIGSYTDIKIREVSNWLSYGLILAMILLRGIEGWLIGNFSNFYLSLGVGAAFFVFGLVMFYTQQWGGADLKLLTMIGIGFSVPLAEINPLYQGIWPSYMTVLMNFFMIAAGYAIVYSLFLSFKTPEIGKDFRASLNKHEVLIGSLLLVVFGALGFVDPLFFMLLILPPMWFLSKYLKIVEKKCLKKKINVKDLREFDIPEESVMVKGKVFVGNNDPNGMTLEQIKKIQSLASKGKLKKMMTVKWGVPLIPVFPLTILATVFIGDLLSMIMTHIM